MSRRIQYGESGPGRRDGLPPRVGSERGGPLTPVVVGTDTEDPDQIADANAGRVSLVLYNLSTGNTVWVVDPEAGGRKFPLEAGGTLEWTSIAALYGYADTAATTIYRLEEEEAR